MDGRWWEGTDAVGGIIQQLPLASTALVSSLVSDRTVEGIVEQLPLADTVLGPSLLDRIADAWKSFLDKQKANLGNEIFWNGWYQYNTYGENFQRNVEAIDLLVGILAFVLEIALSWVPNSKPFERVVLVVSWINCLTAWTIFLWEARSRRAQFALPRFRLPNGEPYGGTIDYVDKYTALGLVMFSTVCMIVNFSGQKISNMGLVLSGVILGAKLHIEYLRRHVKRHSR
ncbi:hypothetical protein CJ030_MR1G028627 [Morella rubra]|uniref:Uncharacterized protein n=1 Tax=Morella rubra TaxID=262757 RepID=A0A6A1WLP3_9ROSI|nr:hypothetical protein CJ030_MR1G028627 [Morella rubra]